MKCPYCNNEMEKGVIQSPHEIAWLRKNHFLGRADLHEGSVVLSEYSFLKGCSTVAWLCRECCKVLIDYQENENE